jgi:hypothetical protein
MMICQMGHGFAALEAAKAIAPAKSDTPHPSHRFPKGHWSEHA